MSSSYHHDLRADLTAGFNELTRNLKDARKVDKVVASLKDTFYDTMRDLIRAWSTMCPISRLPAEVLAMCIGFLPLRSRIAATHVSHTWRVAAVGVPALWSDITIPSRELCSPKGIFCRILSRTGSLPVDFVADKASDKWLDGPSVPLVLVGHMHHMRLVRWPGAAPLHVFSYAAPMLEVFETWGDGLRVNFLGGCAGRLRTLHMGELVLPETCPAVATVTDLRFRLPTADGSAARAPARLSLLFVLFPKLRSLAMTSMHASHANVLCGLTPLRPLSTLMIGSRELICDVFTVLEAWQTDHMEDVRLSLPLDSMDSQNFGSYILKARSLIVDVFRAVDASGDVKDRWVIVFEARTWEGLSHSVRLDYSNFKPEYRYNSAAACIRWSQTSLAQLHALTIPTAAFAALYSDEDSDVALPALSKLTLEYEKHAQTSSDINCWPLEDLRVCVTRLTSHPVQSLVVEMRTCGRADTPSRDDVHMLLNELATIAPYMKASTDSVGAPAMRIRVAGVPGKLIAELSSRLQELGIDCDPEHQANSAVLT